MIWVYAEANPFSSSSGNFLGQIGYLVDALAQSPHEGMPSFVSLMPPQTRSALLAWSVPTRLTTTTFHTLIFRIFSTYGSVTA